MRLAIVIPALELRVCRHVKSGVSLLNCLRHLHLGHHADVFAFLGVELPCAREIRVFSGDCCQRDQAHSRYGEFEFHSFSISAQRAGVAQAMNYRISESQPYT